MLGWLQYVPFSKILSYFSLRRIITELRKTDQPPFATAAHTPEPLRYLSPYAGCTLILAIVVFSIAMITSMWDSEDFDVQALLPGFITLVLMSGGAITLAILAMCGRLALFAYGLLLVLACMSLIGLFGLVVSIVMAPDDPPWLAIAGMLTLQVAIISAATFESLRRIRLTARLPQRNSSPSAH